MVGAQVATESDTAIDAFVGLVDVVDDQRTVRAVHLVPAATTPSVTVPTNTHWQAQRPLTAGAWLSSKVRDSSCPSTPVCLTQYWAGVQPPILGLGRQHDGSRIVVSVDC